MKCQFIILSFLLVTFACSVTQAGTFDTNGHIECGNENYSFAKEMTFSSAKGNNDWIMFNSTYFNVTSANPINITLSHLDDNIAGATSGDSILTFIANTTAGTVWFNISGFEANHSYSLFIDGTYNQLLPAGPDGTINLSWNSWSNHTFDFRLGTQTLQVYYEIGMTDMRSVGNSVSAILGIFFIVGSIMLIIGYMYSKGYIFNK